MQFVEGRELHLVEMTAEDGTVYRRAGPYGWQQFLVGHWYNIHTTRDLKVLELAYRRWAGVNESMLG